MYNEKKNLEKYLQVMIDNWYKRYLTLNVDMFKIWWCFLTDNINWVIMQWEAIKAVSKAIRNNLVESEWYTENPHINSDKIKAQTKYIWLENKRSFNIFNDLYKQWDEVSILYKIENILTRELAYSIRDDKRDDFIRKILDLLSII